MSLYPWILTEKRKKLRGLVEKTPDGHKDFSQILEVALEEWIKTHSQSYNPQSILEQFKDPTFRAVPAISLNHKSWAEYYKGLSKKEILEMDRKLNMIIKIHNSAYKEKISNDY